MSPTKGRSKGEKRDNDHNDGTNKRGEKWWKTRKQQKSTKIRCCAATLELLFFREGKTIVFCLTLCVRPLPSKNRRRRMQWINSMSHVSQVRYQIHNSFGHISYSNHPVSCESILKQEPSHVVKNCQSQQVFLTFEQEQK